MFNSLKISSTGLLTERLRLEAISANIANINNTELDENGQVYKRKQVLLGEDNLNFEGILNGVKVTSIQESNATPNYKYDPENPLAIQEGELKGYVAYPNIDLNKEMTDLINSNRAFQLNSQTFNTSKSILDYSIAIGK